MSSPESIEGLLAENRRFEPSASFRSHAHVKDPNVREVAARDPDAWWAAFARDLAWERPWDKVLDWTPPHARWFVGGKLNASVNCVDRHLATRGSKTALIWEGEPGDRRSLTYSQLSALVNRTANGLRSLGVAEGDRVIIYMPLIPEAVATMLACARLGAIHSVVFAGFSAHALKERIIDSGAKVVVTTNGAWRRGQVIDLKANVDAALAEARDAASVQHVLVHDRIAPGTNGLSPNPAGRRDVAWADVVEKASPHCPPVPLDAEAPLFTLYTSGTTGRPKGILHTTGGYLVGVYATMRMVFDINDSDVFWCTADIGWVTGHSYVVYGPLAAGATVFIYEGTPDFPDKDRYWALIEAHKVSILYTAPTAIRAFMKWGAQYPSKHDLRSLRLLGSVGEPINPEAWIWYYETIGGKRCPVVDTWWQTETGMILITTLPGIDAMRPGFAGKPLPGIEAILVDSEGAPVDGASGGYLLITRPWPAMFRTVWNDPQRYVDTYWKRFFPRYFPADGAKADAGYLMILGRVDDVMNVSGHRLSSMEIESALVDHPSVAEAAVVGRDDPLTGQTPLAFVILKASAAESPALAEELRGHVAKVIGAIAKPKQVIFVPDLPKTRSGKIMRRLLRDIAEGRPPGDVTTLADPSVVERIAARVQVGSK
ncbi:MAG: acetate--CoA ligase [Thermoplasmatota archaeon]